jgi:hypothetical protein
VAGKSTQIMVSKDVPVIHTPVKGRKKNKNE